MDNAATIGGSREKTTHSGRRGDFEWVRRGYNNLRLMARADKLSFNFNHTDVEAAAETAHREVQLWLDALPPEERGWMWNPRKTTYARFLGFLHTGVALKAKKGPDGKTQEPIPEWNLSGNELAPRLGMSRTTFQVLSRYLGSEPIFAPSSKRSEAVGQGLGWIEREQQIAPMRVKFKSAPGHQAGESADQHDMILPLNGPAITRLSSHGLQMLGFSGDHIEQQLEQVARARSGEDLTPPEAPDAKKNPSSKPVSVSDALMDIVRTACKTAKTDSEVVHAVKLRMPSIPEAQIVSAVEDVRAEAKRYESKAGETKTDKPIRYVPQTPSDPKRVALQFESSILADLESSKPCAPNFDDPQIKAIEQSGLFSNLAALGLDANGRAAAKSADAFVERWTARIERDLNRKLAEAELSELKGRIRDQAYHHFVALLRRDTS